MATEPPAGSDPDFMQSLARGLAVLGLFRDAEVLSVSSAAAASGLARPTVRRCFHTLERLGFVRCDAAGRFYLTQAVTRLGAGFRQNSYLARCVEPVLLELSRELEESCSVGVLDGKEIVYLCRAQKRSIVSIKLEVGSRLPAFCTSIGRAIVSASSPSQRETFLSLVALEARTPKTVQSKERLRELIEEAARLNYAIVDEELEPGLRSAAVPIVLADGTVLGAMNVGTVSTHSVERLQKEVVPALKLAVNKVVDQMG
jgi:IclR family pca regulon transcriptional regulator